MASCQIHTTSKTNEKSSKLSKNIIFHFCFGRLIGSVAVLGSTFLFSGNPRKVEI